MTDKDLYGGLIRLHILHHAAEEPVFGLGIIEEPHLLCYSAERELYGTATLQHYGGGLEYLVIGLELGAGHQCSPSVWVGAEAVAAAAIVAN